MYEYRQLALAKYQYSNASDEAAAVLDAPRVPVGLTSALTLIPPIMVNLRTAIKVSATHPQLEFTPAKMSPN
jgi:hypothetical protein